jgi:hypothetical protein
MSAYDPIDDDVDYPLLDTALVEAVAVRVTELLADQLQPSPAPPAAQGPARRLTAAEVSEWWGLQRGWVYQHATELAVIRIGDGQRPRLRFDPDKVARYLETQPQTPTPSSSCQPVRARRSRPMRADAPRLAFRADSELSSQHNNQEVAGRRANAPGRGAEEPSFGAMTSLPPTTRNVGPSRPAGTLRRRQQRR